MKKSILGALIAAGVAGGLTSCDQPGIGKGEVEIQEITQQEQEKRTIAMEEFMLQNLSRINQGPMILKQTNDVTTVLSRGLNETVQIIEIDSLGNIINGYNTYYPSSQQKYYTKIDDIIIDGERKGTQNISTELLAEGYKKLTELFKNYDTKTLK